MEMMRLAAIEKARAVDLEKAHNRSEYVEQKIKESEQRLKQH